VSIESALPQLILPGGFWERIAIRDGHPLCCVVHGRSSELHLYVSWLVSAVAGLREGLTIALPSLFGRRSS
jgi:hypothetical protein